MKTRNFKRLTRTLKTSYSFSDSEISCAIRNWLYDKHPWGSEAQNHFGGFPAMVQAARRSHSYRVKQGLL